MATRASPVIGKGLAALPPPVKALLIAVGIIALAHPGSRRWLAERCVDVGGVVVPHGCLFRGGSEGLIRQRFIEENLLDGVIGLPANLFFGVGIPAALIFFRRNKADKNVFFIDASREYAEGKNQNKLREEDLAKIVTTWRARQNVIMELGWFMARLGRDRVVILYSGDLEIPSDILGVVFLEFKEKIDEVADRIYQRLKGVELVP